MAGRNYQIRAAANSWWRWRVDHHLGELGIEQRREKLAARRALVADWRKHLVPLLSGPQAMEAGTSKYPFMRNEYYAGLRPHLPSDVVKSLEDGMIRIVVGGDNYPRKVIIEQIARIEREWKLI